MRCTTCGEDGICSDGVTEKNVECEADQLSCFISLTTKDGKLVDTKGCLDEGAPQVTEMRGCIHISGPDGINGEYCFCDYDECNSHRCNSEFCSCAFSDPMHCKNITEGTYKSSSLGQKLLYSMVYCNTGSYIKCRTCAGPGCENGENAELKECNYGEGSCLYGRVQTPDRHEVEIMRQCGDVFHGAKLEGCFDLKGFAGADLQVHLT